MNDIIKSMIERRSIKKYKPDMVPKETIDEIINAGLYAANGRGKQSAIIVAVTDKAARDMLSEINCQIGGWDSNYDPFYGAPVVLVVLADKTAPTYVYDGSLTMGNMMLAAQSLGVGSCWIHRAKQVFDSEEGKQILADLGIEGDYEGIGNCIIGYPADEPKPAAPRREGRVFKA
jgi:nitroreductase